MGAEAVVEAGVAHTFGFQVLNPSRTPLSLEAEFFDWGHESGELAVLSPGSTERSAVAWAVASPMSMKVDPESVAEIDVTVTPPADASGGYFFLLSVKGVPTNAPPKGMGAVLLASMVAHVAVRIDDTGTEALDFQRVEIVPPTPTTPLEVVAFAHNDGDVHLHAESRTLITDESGAVRAKLVGRHRIALPGQTVSTGARWTGVLEPGTYNALVSVVYGAGQVASMEQSFEVEAP
jgi:hypothetical protein